MRATQSIEESLKKNTIKIENSNTKNINWTLTTVNKVFNPKQRLTLALKWVLNPNQCNECLDLISIMSAQLLICKFAVFTCVSFF